MLVNKNKFKMSLTEIFLLTASVIFAIGIRYWFPVCMPMGDGYMSCHWAGEILKAVSILITALSLVHIFIPDIKVKTGMNIALAGIWVTIPLIPGRIIAICGNEMMRCRQGTSTGSLLFALLFIIILVIDTVIGLSALASEKHKRK